MIRTTEDGASFEVDGTWELPADIPETLVMECRRWLAALDKASGIAQDGRIKHWLIRLLGGLAGDYSPDTVQLKMGAFVFALSEHQAYCFDDATLKIAMRRFKFWPSAGELIEFADDMDRWTRTTAARAWKVVDAGARTGAAMDGPDAERSMRLNREKAERERREDIALLAERDAAAGKHAADVAVPDRLPGEGDKAYVARLMEHTRGQIAMGHAALKRDTRMRLRNAGVKEATKTAYRETGIEVQPRPDADTASESAETRRVDAGAPGGAA